MKTKQITKIQNVTRKAVKTMVILGFSLLTCQLTIAQDQVTAPAPANPSQLSNNAISELTNGMGLSQNKNGGLWGYVFGDYAWMQQGDSAGRGTKQQYKGVGTPNAGGAPNGAKTAQTTHPNAMEIRRAYLGYDYHPNSRLSGCVLLAYEGDQDVNDNRVMYMKYAYIQYRNIFKGSDLKVGQMATNSFADPYNTEPLCTYRSVEKTILDIHGMDASSDMGVYLGGKIASFKGADSTKFPSFFGYSFMIGDNAANSPVPGFTNAIAQTLAGSSLSPSGSILLNPYNYTTDAAKKFRLHVFFNTLNGALTIGGYGDYINYGNFYYGTSKGYQHAQYTLKGYAVYNSKWFGVGFEYDRQTYINGEVETIWNAANPGKPIVDTANGGESALSIFAHATIIQNCLNLFARFDLFNPDVNYSYNYNPNSNLTSLDNSSVINNRPNETFLSMAPNLASGQNTYTETFINAGVDWTPTKDKKYHIMPNVWYYGIKNGFGSGNLGSDSYILYRVTFLFAF